jgi:hypothetical protein
MSSFPLDAPLLHSSALLPPWAIATVACQERRSSALSCPEFASDSAGSQEMQRRSQGLVSTQQNPAAGLPKTTLIANNVPRGGAGVPSADRRAKLTGVPSASPLRKPSLAKSCWPRRKSPSQHPLEGCVQSFARLSRKVFRGDALQRPRQVTSHLPPRTSCSATTSVLRALEAVAGARSARP